MTARSSSGSWSGAPRAGAADIIDLDRYMRATRPARRPDKMQERLVVDGGLAGARKLAPPLPSAPSSRTAVSAPSASGSASGSGSARSGGDADKRFSHDSGLSDTSYARKPLARRPHGFRSGATQLAPAEKVRTRASSVSLRAFRAALERALRDQQAQIARVAQLCERQAERRSERRLDRGAEQRAVRAERAARAEHTERAERTARSRDLRSCSDSDSDLSSSSRTTDPRRRSKHRSSDCKTYKIIMNKLDELNRLFAARRASSPPAPRAPPPPRDSSGSVTVSDKLVATDFPQTRASSRASARLAGGAPARVVACALSLGVPPTDVTSAVHCSSPEDDSGGATGSDPSMLRGRFDLEDPVHLYAQAKRLQALHATARRARSAGAPRGEARGSGDSALGGGAREVSLCALCRAYWRLARRCLAAPLGAMRGA